MRERRDVEGGGEGRVIGNEEAPGEEEAPPAYFDEEYNPPYYGGNAPPLGYRRSFFVYCCMGIVSVLTLLITSVATFLRTIVNQEQLWEYLRLRVNCPCAQSPVKDESTLK